MVFGLGVHAALRGYLVAAIGQDVDQAQPDVALGVAFRAFPGKNGVQEAHAALPFSAQGGLYWHVRGSFHLG